MRNWEILPDEVVPGHNQCSQCLSMENPWEYVPLNYNIHVKDDETCVSELLNGRQYAGIFNIRAFFKLIRKNLFHYLS